MARLAKGLDLQVTGYRVAPRDPMDPSKPASGEDTYMFDRTADYTIKPRVLKEKLGFGGGYKIQSETMKSKQTRGDILTTENTDENQIGDDSNILTRDEIIKELNLTAGAQIGGDGKQGSLTKVGITKDLVESLSKELEKLRRQSDNIQMRKTLIVEGEIHEETEEEKNYKIQRGLENEGATVVHAENERVQAMRHQTGQLGGLGAITMEEVVAMREQTQERVKQLEIEYYRHKDTKYLSTEMRKRLAKNDPEIEAEKERKRKLKEKETEYDRLERQATEIREKKKFLASPYNPDRTWVRRIPEMKQGEDIEIDESYLMANAK